MLLRATVFLVKCLSTLLFHALLAFLWENVYIVNKGWRIMVRMPLWPKVKRSLLLYLGLISTSIDRAQVEKLCSQCQLFLDVAVNGMAEATPGNSWSLLEPLKPGLEFLLPFGLPYLCSHCSSKACRNSIIFGIFGSVSCLNLVPGPERWVDDVSTQFHFLRKAPT